MKKRNFSRTNAGKITIFLLCTLSMVMTILCLYGTAAIASYEIYTKPLDQLLLNRYETIAEEVIEDIVQSNVSDVKKLRDSSEPLAIQSDSNLRWLLVNAEQPEQILMKDASLSADEIEPPADPSGWTIQQYYFCYNDQYNSDALQIVPVNPARVQEEPGSGVFLRLMAYVTHGTPVYDSFAQTTRVYNLAYQYRWIVIAGALFFALSSLILGILSLWNAGRRMDSTEVMSRPFDKVPYDLLLLVWLCSALPAFCYAMEILFNHRYSIPNLIILLPFTFFAGAFTLLLFTELAARLRSHSLWRNCILCRILSILLPYLRLIFGQIRQLPLIPKTAILVLGITAVEFCAFLFLNFEGDSLFCFWFLEKMLLLPAVFYLVLHLKKLQIAAGSMAEGNLDQKIDTAELRWFSELRLHADHLNHIADGMSIAVSKGVRSERMKTELITNVSHDIKTPLTSIINYGNLIQQSTNDSEKVAEYSAVMVRQSERLKRLLEDLVEASKASTGNLDVIMAPCDASIFLSQAAGEYEEKLQATGLSLITRQPEDPVMILADGRRMLRIFDNLMNNICKYSLPGSRVYLTLEHSDTQVHITFRNTSRDALNISAEELMERFVRGDSSRNTEGNGLGLSIAQSLTQLQNGTMDIIIDGDLFKVVLTFPAMSL